MIPGKLAYAEWYWHAITEGLKPNGGPVDAGSWENGGRWWQMVVKKQ